MAENQTEINYSEAILRLRNKLKIKLENKQQDLAMAMAWIRSWSSDTKDKMNWQRIKGDMDYIYTRRGHR